MKKLISSFMVLLLVAVFSVSAKAAPGDLFVQVDVQLAGPGGGCSILKVTPNGTASEFVSAAAILALTGETTCDMEDTGLAVADNGDVYFSEDISDFVIKATPNGVLSTFITGAEIAAVVGNQNVDLENGMTIGPDGNLYFIDENNDTILKATIPDGDLSIILTRDQVIAVTGDSTADLDGGMDFDCFGNLYFTDTPSDGDKILVLSPSGVLSVFVTEQDINAATGFNSTDLDSGLTFFDSLFVLDDGDCDCVLKITLNGEISVFVSESQITAATGNDNADVDGGIAVNQRRDVIFGDDGDNPNDPNILMSNPIGSNLSILLSTQEIRDFYSPDFDPRLQGSMAIEGVDACVITQIPTLSEWGLIATVLGLGIIGFMVIRRRKLTA